MTGSTQEYVQGMNKSSYSIALDFLAELDACTTYMKMTSIVFCSSGNKQQLRWLLSNFWFLVQPQLRTTPMKLSNRNNIIGLESRLFGSSLTSSISINIRFPSLFVFTLSKNGKIVIELALFILCWSLTTSRGYQFAICLVVTTECIGKPCLGDLVKSESIATPLWMPEVSPWLSTM